jgi:rubrerythrin
MNKIVLSLNFMYCMERFATQIYRTQKPAFHDGSLIKPLEDASSNEKTHVDKLRAQLNKLNYGVYPFGLLFQYAGEVLGFIARLSGKLNLLRADTFVENRAVKDYNGFVKAIPFDADTVSVIREIIADEEIHINNWKKVAEMLRNKKPSTA